FRNCESYYGGAIYTKVTGKGILTIDAKCSFTDCHSQYHGAGIYAEISNVSSQLILQDGIKFQRCNSDQNGGGIYIYRSSSAQLQLNNIPLENCSGRNGGGMFFQNSANAIKQTFTGLNFTNCSADSGGAGIYATIGDTSIIELNTITFSKCVSQGSGGGMECYISGTVQYTIYNLNFLSCTAVTKGGGSYFSFSSGNIKFNSSGQILYDQCVSQQQGGGMYIDSSTNYSLQLTKMKFNYCKAQDGGGMFSYLRNQAKIELTESMSFIRCTSEQGRGGGLFIDMNLSAQCQFVIKDATFNYCSATQSISSSSRTELGGGIFLAGIGDYNLSSYGLDFRGMKISNNAASRGGRSLYVVMSQVKEWCQQGSKGEYVKGNYSDTENDDRDLEGVSMSYTQFNSTVYELIQSQQKYLEIYWNLPQYDIWHVLQSSSSTGVDQLYCGNISKTCKTIEYAIQQISIINAGSETSIVAEKKIGISVGGYNLQSPIELSPTQSFTSNLKMMKQLYGTTSQMSGNAEIKIMKNNDNSKENGKLGWISVLSGMKLEMYYIDIKTDTSTLNIPIIYTVGAESSIYLNSISFIGINLSPLLNAKGLIHIIAYNSEQKLLNCTFQNIIIEGAGGNAIRIMNSGSNPITATISNCQFTNINSVGDSNGRGGSAIYMENKYGSKLLIEDSCKFQKCIIDKGNGGAICIDIDFETQFEFKINNALIQECEAKVNSSSTYQTGYGGGIFLTGSGDYDSSSKRLDLKGMKIYNNIADKSGQSLYVVMAKLAEWCQYGIAGEYVKGNYTDGISNKNELQGIPVSSAAFNSYSSLQINQQQKYLEYYWNTEINCTDVTGKTIQECECIEDDPRSDICIPPIDCTDVTGKTQQECECIDNDPRIDICSSSNDCTDLTGKTKQQCPCLNNDIRYE
ncbi:MAG: hypothetical protein EZS28_034176, partial [Streblomastix strix]